jgi:hypothetical protein
MPLAAQVAKDITHHVAVVLAAPIAICLGMFGFGRYHQDPNIQRAALLGLGYLLALGLSMIIHEGGHGIALHLLPGITALRTERNWFRFSIQPQGSITAAQAIFAALSGPALCFLIGIFGYWGTPYRNLSVIFAAHIVFLLPCFGDGRSILTALRLIVSVKRQRGLKNLPRK